ATAAYLVNRLDEMNTLCEILLKKVHTKFDQALVYEVKLHAHLSSDDRTGALQFGLKALNLLGLRYPAKAGMGHILTKLIQTLLNLRGKSEDDWLNAPLSTELHMIVTARIIRSLFSVLYTNAPELAPLVLMDMVNISLKHGNTSMTPFGLVGFGFIL